jgi:transposase
MARRTFVVFDLTELFTHWHAGRSQVQLSQSLGMDRKTIRKYLAPAIAESITPGQGCFTAEQWSEKIACWFPELADPAARAVTWPEIEAHRDRIVGWLTAEVTVATIAQRLRDDHGVSASESSVRRWITANLAEDVVRSRVTVARGPVVPGGEAQIDYGRLGMWPDPAAGRRVTVWAFVMVLSCSRYLFLQPVIRMNQSSWCASHVAAFEFFGGVPARLVPDNLKTGVEKADLYDPKLNKAYAELATHYDTLIDPARARKPKDKPRVERPMQYVRDSFWRGREFTSLAQMQAEAIRWCVEVAGARNSRALDGQQPGFVFAAVEQSALQPLPPNVFQLAVWSVGKVAIDCHVKVGKALYSVPWRLIGQSVHARSCGDIVQIVHDGTVVATHVLHVSGRATDVEHYPPEKIAFQMRNPTWCRRTAAEVGPACVAVIAEFMEVNAISRLRSAQGVLGLRKTVGSQRLDAACARALQVGDPSYRTIKGILAAGTECDGITEPVAPTAAAFLRGPGAFGADTA